MVSIKKINTFLEKMDFTRALRNVASFHSITTMTTNPLFRELQP